MDKKIFLPNRSLFEYLNNNSILFEIKVSGLFPITGNGTGKAVCIRINVFGCDVFFSTIKTSFLNKEKSIFNSKNIAFEKKEIINEFEKIKQLIIDKGYYSEYKLLNQLRTKETSYIKSLKKQIKDVKFNYLEEFHEWIHKYSNMFSVEVEVEDIFEPSIDCYFDIPTLEVLTEIKEIKELLNDIVLKEAINLKELFYYEVQKIIRTEINKSDLIDDKILYNEEELNKYLINSIFDLVNGQTSIEYISKRLKIDYNNYQKYFNKTTNAFEKKLSQSPESSRKILEVLLKKKDKFKDSFDKGFNVLTHSISNRIYKFFNLPHIFQVKENGFITKNDVTEVLEKFKELELNQIESIIKAELEEIFSKKEILQNVTFKYLLFVGQIEKHYETYKDFDEIIESNFQFTVFNHNMLIWLSTISKQQDHPISKPKEEVETIIDFGKMKKPKTSSVLTPKQMAILYSCLKEKGIFTNETKSHFSQYLEMLSGCSKKSISENYTDVCNAKGKGVTKENDIKKAKQITDINKINKRHKWDDENLNEPLQNLKKIKGLLSSIVDELNEEIETFKEIYSQINQ